MEAMETNSRKDAPKKPPVGLELRLVLADWPGQYRVKARFIRQLHIPSLARGQSARNSWWISLKNVIMFDGLENRGPRGDVRG